MVVLSYYANGQFANKKKIELPRLVMRLDPSCYGLPSNSGEAIT